MIGRSVVLALVLAANDPRRADVRHLRRLLEHVARRGREMRRFVDAVRERGDVAIVEEIEDLPRLRLAYCALRTALRPRGVR